MRQQQLPITDYIAIIAFSGLAVGAIVYYLMSEREKLLQHHGVQPVDKSKLKAALLATLPPKEKEVVKVLLDHNGSVSQYELTRLSGLNKVQTHRVLLKMEKQGTITKTNIGKVNKIELSKDIMSAL